MSAPTNQVAATLLITTLALAALSASIILVFL
jgi:hypothetical protein